MKILPGWLFSSVVRFCLAAFTLVACTLVACTKAPPKVVTIAINPWPGYEFLYLAETKGYLQTTELKIKLVQLSSLSDVKRAYATGRVEGMTSTLIEAVQAQFLGQPLEIVLIPDYSNGGDVILASTSINDVSALKGKTVGCEVSSLGIYMLQRALQSHGMSIEDVNVLNVEQLQGEQSMLNGTIDAFVSYPPVSVEISKYPQFHSIFSSADIPSEVIDSIAISKTALAQHPELVKLIHQAWDRVLRDVAQDPQSAYAIMAEREGISVEDFTATLDDLKIIDGAGQQQFFTNPQKLQQATRNVCKTLEHVGALRGDCNELPNTVYQGAIQ